MAPGKRWLASNCQIPAKLIVNQSAPSLGDWASYWPKDAPL